VNIPNFFLVSLGSLEPCNAFFYLSFLADFVSLSENYNELIEEEEDD